MNDWIEPEPGSGPRSQSGSLLNGLGAAIENAVLVLGPDRGRARGALLLIKGVSHKEITTGCAVSERTVRDQARAEQ